ncbi:MAG: deoxyribodipyrimidine photo-lyase [Rhodobacteraceae bacterium]|nr:deoxyribodipyrimidine photo-lyase [Paracoccaceae bacterium]
MTAPLIWWVRRDFRLADNPGLAEAAACGRPVIPVFILDEVAQGLGACPKWRLGLGATHFSGALEALGSRLIFRKGPALDVLRTLIRDTGADTVWWGRAYDPDAISRDTTVKSGLKSDGIAVRSIPGSLLFEPWTAETKTGGFYRVYTPFWKSLRDRDVGTPAPTVTHLPAPDVWPESDDPHEWGLADAMNRGAEVVQPYLGVGEGAASDRLERFLESGIAGYATARDSVADNATSLLSENLAVGEISPRTAWYAGRHALEQGVADAEIFLKELVWREFAYHLAYHTPHITSGNWRPEWDAFPWNTDPDHPHVIAWKQGRTGIPFVDAAMREMYVTGRMHNRARMIVASYLTKHLLTDWRIGLKWFEDCLADWDPASNAMGWQWSAGSGPDATPYFRVFNPVTQREKFDPAKIYVRRWIAEGQIAPPNTALKYFDAVPRSWGLGPSDLYPAPIVDAADGRARALDAYQSRSF